MSRFGEGNYNLIFNNCQHFARWCATGDHESEQVRSVTATTRTVITPALATALTGTVIGPAGLVTGLSGPGIMSGLATYGALAGGGAVAGLVVLGTAPALTSVAIMHHALRKDEDLPVRSAPPGPPDGSAQPPELSPARPSASPPSARSASRPGRRRDLLRARRYRRRRRHGWRDGRRRSMRHRRARRRGRRPRLPHLPANPVAGLSHAASHRRLRPGADSRMSRTTANKKFIRASLSALPACRSRSSDAICHRSGAAELDDKPMTDDQGPTTVTGDQALDLVLHS